jgi:hypothetical protein
VTWALDRDDTADRVLALRIIGALAFESSCNPAAGIGAWAERALPHLAITSPQLRYAVTAAAARLLQNLGNYQEARELAQQAIGDGVPLGAPAPGVAFVTLAMSSGALGEPERGLAIALDTAPVMDRDFPGSSETVLAHQTAAILATQAGDRITARAEAEIAVQQARQYANPTALAGTLMTYGWTLIPEDLTAALGALDETSQSTVRARPRCHSERSCASRQACASAPATYPTRLVTSAKQSNEPTRTAVASPSTPRSCGGSTS